MGVVLITGCSSGIGRLAAFEFARNGDRVFATVRGPADLSQLADDAQQRGLPITALRMDLAERSSIEEAVQRILDETGEIDVLVNNAGIAINGAFEDLADGDIERIFRTNFFGPVWLTRAMLPQMRSRTRGRIIMVSSLSALVGLPGDGFYAASKAALERATESLGREVEAFDIKVSIVEPGLYRTRMTEQLAASGSAPPDSPYARLLEAVAARTAANLTTAPEPREGAQLLVDIARTPEPLIRYPAGAAATGVHDAIFRRSPEDYDAWLRSISTVD